MQQSKALSQIDITEGGIVTCFSIMQLLKVKSSIDVIDSGIVISVNFLHPLKNLGPIWISFSDNKRLIISWWFFRLLNVTLLY